MAIIGVIEILLGIIMFVTPIALYFGVYPWYVCEYTEYDMEVLKAQKVSNIFMIKIDTGYQTFFENKVDYEKIRIEIIDFMLENLSTDYHNVIGRLEMEEKYKGSSNEICMDIIYSIFGNHYDGKLYKEFFEKYPVKLWFTKFQTEFPGVTKLSDEELDKLGLLKYRIEVTVKKC